MHFSLQDAQRRTITDERRTQWRGESRRKASHSRACVCNQSGFGPNPSNPTKVGLSRGNKLLDLLVEEII
ncbi:hypothetical protein Nepgr_022382 [Nepenthes gracilis]|uniref:Uncharacterized protein n=1 Tax=Nepenthes gracilis TaxID=150966 RepID=A0AAD3T2G8_NEPGR|nr:hypothetical protein Nepgr_022382 [Nepenthes gracilis]